MHHPYRIMVAGSDLTGIRASLESKLASSNTQRKTRVSQRVAVAFTGQGSQYLGMERELLKITTFCGDLNRFDALCQTLGFPLIVLLIQHTETDIASRQLLVVQVGMMCIQMVMAKLWQSWGVVPSTVIGHSLGEYAALNIAGVLSEADTIVLVGNRAQLIQEHISANTHAMLTVNTSVEEINIICENLEYEIACINSPFEMVLSGMTGEVESALLSISAAGHVGLRKTRLIVPFTFHSSQMQPILDESKPPRGL